MSIRLEKLVFGINVYIHFMKTFALHVCFLSADIPKVSSNASCELEFREFEEKDHRINP